MHKPHIAIITPALAKANNGNWQTARRWARFLSPRYRTTIDDHWSAHASGPRPDALIALHARRSAPAVEAFCRAFPGRPVVVVMTGTDIYRDIRTDAAACRTMESATALVVLQAAALDELDPAAHDKTTVIHQSAPALHAPNARSSKYFDVSMIGHLRDEKDPMTFIRAAGLVRSPRVRLIHIGGVLDSSLEAAVHAEQEKNGRYRWLGSRPRSEVRQRLKRCALMAITSRMEGGANVVIEAITSGVPVLASDISGNRGLLGDSYAGYFPVGDHAALARLIDRAEAEPAFLSLLAVQCAERAPLFLPDKEKATLLQLMDTLLVSRHA